MPTKVHLVKAMVFPVVMCGCESWVIKKAESWRIDAFKLWCWRRLLRVPWTTRRSNQAILNEINPEYSSEGLVLKLKLQYFGRLMGRANSLEQTLIWERLKAGGVGDNRGWDGWMASPTQWIWVWASSGRYWRTGKSGVLQSMGLQRVGHDWGLNNNLLIASFKHWRNYFNCPKAQGLSCCPRGCDCHQLSSPPPGTHEGGCSLGNLGEDRGQDPGAGWSGGRGWSLNFTFYLLALSPWQSDLVTLSFSFLVFRNRRKRAALPWCRVLTSEATRTTVLEKQVGGVGRSWWEMQNLRLHLDLLGQNLHFNKKPPESRFAGT